MSNTPSQQAELYRKAAETIEMCAEHGIEPMVKLDGDKINFIGLNFDSAIKYYEFPITVIEGQLVWADTIVYNCRGIAVRGSDIHKNYMPYTLIPPKQPLCEVEGKPVYKGDMLWLPKYKVAQYVSDCWSKKDFEMASWNPPKRTVMVKLLVEDAEFFKEIYYKSSGTYGRVSEASRKALDNLK